MRNLIFPTIHENTPFFFWLEFNSNNKAKVGDGSKLSPLRIFMTSIKMLRNINSSNQIFIAIYHLDGT